MKRTTIMLPDDVDALLRLEARRRGTTIAEVAREAIEQHLPSPAPGGRLGFFGIGAGAGAPPDASQHVDEIVAGAIARHRPSSPA